MADDLTKAKDWIYIRTLNSHSNRTGHFRSINCVGIEEIEIKIEKKPNGKKMKKNKERMLKKSYSDTQRKL